MSDSINDLIEAVWESHGDSEVWVKLANEAAAQNDAMRRENERLNNAAIRDEDLNGPPPSATQLREAIYRIKELTTMLKRAVHSTDLTGEQWRKDALQLLSPTQETDPE